MRFLPASEVMKRTNYRSINSIYRLEREEGFPKRRKLGGRVGWIEEEVDEWIRNRPTVEEVQTV